MPDVPASDGGGLPKGMALRNKKYMCAWGKGEITQLNGSMEQLYILSPEPK